ncbi:MAG: 2-octaprenyl-3-methyl-6-methoxy,4-benzoquinol hydroxylase [Rhizobacter sp.]|nr:2-octaprenyl-3-methyl-6-methoxy,4-benzoquinol hydroxylase [Rhizobacter sp.]
MQPPPLSVDAALSMLDNALRTLSGAHSAGRPYPAATPSAAELSESEQRLSGSLMRVNHVGEVCAQALYQAQAATTRNPELREQFLAAAREETDHLAWTTQRLRELNARPSLLNPLWFAGSAAIGLLAGRASDRFSLGFVVETERQVEKHLDSHLERLPAADNESRAVVRQMKDDEIRHAMQAEQSGATRLPFPVRMAMRLAAKVMTRTAHYL